MARRAVKRRRVTTKNHDDATDSSPDSPARSVASDPARIAALDKDWQGWAEIESDPAFFNVMLRDLGVRDVAVREIFSLDNEMLAFLPRPVHGVIFLFRWKEDEEKVDTRYKAGSKVWFANQTVSNACASYAILNIVNNIPGLQLGHQLDHFRDFTRDFTPALRGDALSNFEFVKKIHNSFTRRMDKLNGDLHIKSQVEAAKQKSRKRKATEDDEEPAYHFIAFMPIDDVLWKMDGLEWQPRSLGRVKQGDDWLDMVKSNIESRMSRYSDDDIDFAILGLVKEPLLSRVAELATNVSALNEIRARLEALRDGKPCSRYDDNTLVAADLSYGLDSEDIARAPKLPAVSELLKFGSVADLEGKEEDLAASQESLRRAIKEEQAAQFEDDAKANKRRHDYGEAIHHWTKFLVRKAAVRKLISEDDA